MKKLQIECAVCGKSDTFIDTKAITHSRWNIIAWSINTNEPVCTCDSCDYSKKNDVKSSTDKTKKSKDEVDTN